ncbi:MAG: hypothetical protein HY860_02920 [Chlamydiales bacterium]|nr:hypothetical protein [Chlamydiales bacterium]
MSRNIDRFVCYLIRGAMYPLQFASPRLIHHLGKGLGIILYYLHPKFRKRALSNLALATTLQLSSKEIVKIAKESFQSLCITFLEYPKLSTIKNIQMMAYCENKEAADQIIQQGKGIIFFCAHQANWEMLFLEGTSRMKGVAIGRPIKNMYLYAWVKKIREKFGGTIIDPKNAIKEGLRTLKAGKFLGIVGDQGMPESFFQSPFFGRNAYTSPIPAILAYRTNSPIIFASIRRKNFRYCIHYSDPIWPNVEKPQEEAVKQMMEHLLDLLQESIKENKGEWLWQHNRYKQETPANVYYRFRHDSILVILPMEKEDFLSSYPLVESLRKIYPKAFIDVLCPDSLTSYLSPSIEVIPYKHKQDILLDNYKHKLVFNFTSYSIHTHFMKKSALEVIDFNKLKHLAKKYSHQDFFPTHKEMLFHAISRKEVFLEEKRGLHHAK